MRGTAHFVLSAGVTGSIAYALTRSPEATAALALAVGAASLLPDLDAGASLGASLLRLRWLSRGLQATIGHRGPLTHSLAACVAWSLLWGFATAVVFAPAGQAPSLRAAGTVFGVVLAGSAAHVVEDWLPIGSRSGVPILWPIRKERLKFRLRPVRSRRAVPSP